MGSGEDGHMHSRWHGLGERVPRYTKWGTFEGPLDIQDDDLIVDSLQKVSYHSLSLDSYGVLRLARCLKHSTNTLCKERIGS